MLTSQSFLLAIDGVVVSQRINTPLAAVGLLFGSFYIFNLHYPATASVTLQFIQRYDGYDNLDNFLMLIRSVYVCH
jgi:hypothetical protein